MNARTILAAAALLAATTSVMAQEVVVPDAGFVSTKSRAEVRAELDHARAAGNAVRVNSEFPEPVMTASTTTREQVKQELAAAQADGTSSTRQVDGIGSNVLAVAPGKTRQQVLNELQEHQRQNPLGDVYTSYKWHFGG